MMERKKYLWPLLTIAAVCFSLPEKSMAQYSDAEIRYATGKLQEWNLLDQIVKLTSDDQRQSATRADVLVASFQVVRELKKIDLSDLQTGLNRTNSALQGLRRQVNTLKSTPAAATTDDSVLVQKVMAEVEKTLADLPQKEPQVEKLEKDVQDLRTALAQMRKESGSEPAKIASLERSVSWNRRIAVVAVLAAVTMTVMSAR